MCGAMRPMKPMPPDTETQALLKAKPDDLISWYVWAEDIGPDGKVRRTNGDLYFAEVRPFDAIFRESQDMPSDEDQQGQQGGGNNEGEDAKHGVLNE